MEDNFLYSVPCDYHLANEISLANEMSIDDEMSVVTLSFTYTLCFVFVIVFFFWQHLGFVFSIFQFSIIYVSMNCFKLFIGVNQWIVINFWPCSFTFSLLSLDLYLSVYLLTYLLTHSRHSHSKLTICFLTLYSP